MIAIGSLAEETESGNIVRMEFTAGIDDTQSNLLANDRYRDEKQVDSTTSGQRAFLGAEKVGAGRD